MRLHNLPQRKNRIKPSKRVGRGPGSGKGMHTSGRGMKGQLSRAGHKSMIIFEGGNLPFYKKIPKYPGFKRIQKVSYQPVNLSVLDEFFKSGDTVSLETLREKGLIKKKTQKVKILADGEINKKLTVENLTLSGSAEKAILDAGGEIK